MNDKPKNATVSTSILKHLRMFISLRKSVLALCRRSAQAYENAELHQMLLRINDEPKNQAILQELEGQVKLTKADMVYYQRQIYNQNQQHVFNTIVQTIKQISSNSKHPFYKNRKHQIQVIKDIIIMLNFLSSKFKQYMSFMEIQAFGSVNEEIVQIMKCAQKIKFENVQNKKLQNCQIIYNFPTKISSNYNTTKNNGKQEKCHSYRKDLTDATTRTPSAHHTEFGSTNLTRKLDYTTENMEFINHKKQIRRPTTGKPKTQYGKEVANCKNKFRPQTARNNHEKFQNIQENKKQYLRRDNANSQRQIIKQSSLKLQIAQRNTETKDLKKNKIQKQQKKSSNIVLSPQRSVQKSNQINENKNKLKKQRKKGEFMWTENRLNNLLTLGNDENLQEYIRKRTWKASNISQNLNANDYLKNHFGRKFKSHQNFNYISSPNKTHKRFKNNYKQKKKLYRFNSKKLLKIAQSNENIQQIYEVIKPPVLYIKTPIQNQSQWKARDYLMKAKVVTPQLELATPRNSDNLNINKPNSKNIQLNKSAEEQKIQVIVSDQIFKVQIERVNQIRNQFVKARTLNPYMTPFDKQNSVFFIQQGIISHKSNVEFQKHLNELKQNGSVLAKQPFVIQCEFNENNNEKLKECQRYYTFKSEEEWLNTHILKQKNTKEFGQSNLQAQRLELQI